MVSPYLERPIRTLEQALEERARLRAALHGAGLPVELCLRLLLSDEATQSSATMGKRPARAESAPRGRRAA